MRTIIQSIAAATILMPVLAGCCCNEKKSSEVARAQGPVAVSGDACYDDCDDQNCEKPKKKRCKFCRGLGCGKCCRPYRVPNGLSYPPDTYSTGGQMPAVVQYPYYTCKGPDCFFKQ